MSARLLTPHGRGAVATIEVSNPTPLFVAKPPPFRAVNGRPLQEQPLERPVFGHWGVVVKEDVVVCRTSVDRLEIHCHGGDAATRRILKDLESIGIPHVTEGSGSHWDSRWLEAECLDVAITALTSRAAECALRQASGLLREAISGIVEGAASGNSPNSLAQTADHLDELLRWSSLGRHLAKPWRVALVGRPNAGKSSLMNALVGYGRSIVYDQPGTTRDVVTAETAFEGWPIQLSDTAGIREATDELEAAGIALAKDRMESSDLVILVVDGACSMEEQSSTWMAPQERSLVAFNKMDLPESDGRALWPEALAISCRTGEGIAALGKAIAQRLVPLRPDDATAVPVSDRMIHPLSAARDAARAGARARCLESLQGLLNARGPLGS